MTQLTMIASKNGSSLEKSSYQPPVAPFTNMD